MADQVHQHPDGLVYVRTAAVVYCDTLENAQLDFGVVLPALPIGADERFYVKDVKHPFMGGGNVIGVGQQPWTLGDQMITNVNLAISNQEMRKAESLSGLDPLKLTGE